MGYDVLFLAPALEDLDSIIVYLSQFYPSTPQRFLDALDKVTLNLQDFPYIYPVYQENPAYRKAGVSNYLAFYMVHDEKRLIEIHRILPGTWDIPRYLKP
jgi:plasmid stabilization system protein ParE